MTDFYFIRHGQTDANLQGIMCGGQWDISLNVTGFEQAAKASEYLKSRVSHIHSICASPLIRTQQTAGFFAEAYGLSIELIDELREWKIGSWEKVSFESIKEEFLGKGEPPGDGENRAIFHARVQAAFKKCSTADAPTLIVSHGGVGLALQSILGTHAERIENCVPHHVYRNSQGIWKAELV